MTDYTTLFEQQSYQDALEYYLAVLSDDRKPTWDYVLLTASNEAQAKAYTMQIKHRLANGQLPGRTHYAVIPDRNGQRIGSGGATLSCVRYLYDHAGSFRRRVLVIHSGGDSKRVPQYSACGKLFSPVPRLLPDGRRSTLFDEFMIGMSTVASRIREGMLVCSGDVLLLFNALQIDFYGGDTGGAAALSIKEHVSTGKDHGVYLPDEGGFVGKFLHKQTEKTLADCGAVDARGNVNIDTGAVILAPGILSSLYSLIDTPESYRAYVNDRARLSFYADFLYPMASGSTLEQFYEEKPEGDFTPELRQCRTALWNVLHPYKMKLIRLSPASFIHFGTTRELLHLMTDGMEQYRFLGWKRAVNGSLTPKDYAISNSYVSPGASVGPGSYIEDCRIHSGSAIGSRCVISGVTMAGSTVPDGTVLHGLKLTDGRFVCRMYGVDDNPKETKLFGRELGQPLWTAPLYPVCDTMEEAVRRTLAGDAAGELLSLQGSFLRADVTQIVPWQENLYEQVVAEAILDEIRLGVPAEDVKAAYPKLRPYTEEYLVRKAEALDIQNLTDFSRCIRIFAYLGKITGKTAYADRCLAAVCRATLQAAEGSVRYDDTLRLVRDETVRLPVRVNFGGGWSDTPPYCMENGGTVLNAAISFGGKLPVEASVRPLNRQVIALASTDIGSYREFDRLEQLQDCRDPADPFALHKAALIACGVIPYQVGGEVAGLCGRLGSGMYMNTRVIDIPKGSGLGTSSILAGACVRALLGAMGKHPTDSEVFEKVLCMEQLMSTGGGWQDQVGGIAPGIKLISTQPGLKQHIRCVPCDLSTETLAELNRRFKVIYTGQRRLARNLLRDVVSRYICNDPESLDAHGKIQRLAVLMRFELEKGNVDGFARLLTQHWEQSKRIDAGSTNTCIDQIFLVIDDLIDGRMICGAGGGGFLQVVLKKGVSTQDLRARLEDVFQDSGVAVWDCEFVS